MMKSRLKTLVGAGESTGQGPQGDSSVSHDLELLARFQDYPRQELGSSKFYNKFQSGFSANIIVGLKLPKLTAPRMKSVSI